MKAMGHKMLYAGEILYSKMDYTQKMNFIISTASILGKKCKMQNRHCNDNASETEEKTKTENCVYAHTFE